MRVIATAGHVDHGKSTLVRALTGTDPDRWAEEHRRGLTIDLGYAWTTIGDETFAFVDVPGHQRFIANMLAGLGPAPGVLFVVAADEGWRQQSTEHLAAVRALGIRHGVVAITRADLADPGPASADVRRRLAGTPLADAEIVACSGATGEGLPELRRVLVRLATGLPAPTTPGRVRMWLDRAFTLKGHGTVVTGTLESGRLATGDTVRLVGPGRPGMPTHAAGDRGRDPRGASVSGGREAVIRGLHSLGEPHPGVVAVARVAVNLRGVATDDLARGDALLTGPWHLTTVVDVRLNTGDADPASIETQPGLPEYVVAHVGTAAMQVRIRPLGETNDGIARLTWAQPLPLQAGDRMVLRDPGRRQVLAGALALDADPPALRRRGDARRRAEALAAYDGRLDVAVEVGRRGWMRADDLLALGATPRQLDTAFEAGDLRSVAEGASDANHRRAMLIAPERWASWCEVLRGEVRRAAASNPLQARAQAEATASRIGLPAGTPTSAVLAALASDAGLELTDGYLQVPGARADLGDAEASLAEVERRLAERPFAAPEKDGLAALGLGRRELAAAVRLGRLIDLGDQVVLAPTAPALAMRTLATLPGPFTASAARQALGTTRRVVLPLLIELDRRGWTRRLNDSHRVVVRASD